MPTYLLHGFRWHRNSIRIHIALYNLDDAAAEWIVAPATSITLLNSFYTLYDFLPPSNPPAKLFPSSDSSEGDAGEGGRYLIPDAPNVLVKKQNHKGSIGRRNRPQSLGTTLSKNDSRNVLLDGDGRPSTSTTTTNASAKGKKPPVFNYWSAIKLVEQYDPRDLEAATQPWAYVADYLVEVSLGTSVGEEMRGYEERIRGEGLSSPLTPGTMPGGENQSMHASGREESESYTVGGGQPLSPGMSAREMRRKSRRLGWLEKLRDGLQKGEEIGWYVVVCGDEERVSSSEKGRRSFAGEGSWDEGEKPMVRTPRSAGLRGFFGKRKGGEGF